jgi:hypothetical protein
MSDIKIPADHQANCDAGGYLSTGNAGGNTENWLDSSNFVTRVAQENNGAVYSGPGSKVRRRGLVGRQGALW